MPWYEIVYFVIALIIMLFGMVGILLPVVPGIPLILAAAFIYGVLTNFADINGNLLLIFTGLTLLSILLDYLATMFGVKKMGGSNMGVIGALVGMIAGLLIPGVGIFGFIIGAFLGAFLFEILLGKSGKDALRSGFGSFIGFMLGGLLRFVIGAVMIGMFFYNVII